MENDEIKPEKVEVQLDLPDEEGKMRKVTQVVEKATDSKTTNYVIYRNGNFEFKMTRNQYDAYVKRMKKTKDVSKLMQKIKALITKRIAVVSSDRLSYKDNLTASIVTVERAIYEDLVKDSKDKDQTTIDE